MSELSVTGTMKDAHNRTVKVGVRDDRVEFVITPSSGHDGRMALRVEQQEEFARYFVAACFEAKANAEQARRASGMNKVERAARDLIGIPDGL